MEIQRTSYVYISNIYAGQLQQTDEGYCFIYDKEYIKQYNKQLSLTMPIQDDIYTSKVLFPFFDGLIPEGWLLQEVVNKWKLNTKDRFGILLASAKDPIGNVSIREEKNELSTL